MCIRDRAAALTDNLKGDLERLGGAIDTALIQGGSGANTALRGLVQTLDGAVSAFAELPAPLQATATALAAVSAAALLGVGAVSYTHLDVYKRQLWRCCTWATPRLAPASPSRCSPPMPRLRSWPTSWGRWLRTLADDVVEPIAARIESVVGATRTVYRYGVPDGPLPDTYILVTASVGETSSTNLAGLADRRAPSVDVKSVSRSPDRRQAAREALWGARKVVDSLTDFRPAVERRCV